MRVKSALVLGTVILAGSALNGLARAEEPAAAPVTAETPQDDKAKRLELARELHDVRRIKDRVLSDFDRIAAGLPESDQEDFKVYMEQSVDFDALEKKSIEIAAEVYTADELKAMVDYYSSNAGRSAEAKGEEYSKRFGDILQQKVDAAIMASKYGAQNGASSTGNFNTLSPSESRKGPSIDMLGK